jgi:hypothetical protein
MRYIDETRDLTEQLDEALQDVGSGREVAMEAAILAGMVARRRVAAPQLERADAWRDRNPALGAELRPLLEEVLESLFPEDETGLDAEDLLGDLNDLDDVAAAATWLGDATWVAEATARALRVLALLPSVTLEFASMAEEVLAEGAPLAGDPSVQLWRAILASRPPAPREPARMR